MGQSTSGNINLGQGISLPTQGFTISKSEIFPDNSYMSIDITTSGGSYQGVLIVTCTDTGNYLISTQALYFVTKVGNDTSLSQFGVDINGSGGSVTFIIGVDDSITITNLNSGGIWGHAVFFGHITHPTV